MNSPALSTLKRLIGLLGNCALSRIMCDSILAKTRLRVDRRDTLDHLVEEQIITRKYMKGPLAGVMGPQTSALSCSRKSGML